MPEILVAINAHGKEISSGRVWVEHKPGHMYMEFRLACEYFNDWMCVSLRASDPIQTTVM